MSLFGLLEKRATLANPDSWMLGLFGGRATDSGLSVSEQNALTYTTVYACVQVIAESLATIPLNLYLRKSNGDHEVVSTLPVSRLLQSEPNEEMSASAFKSVEMGWVLTWGNGYAEIERNNAGLPIALHPLAPNRIVPRRRLGDWRIEYYVTRQAMVTPYQLEQVVPSGPPIDRDDMLHFAGLGFDGIVGYSPIGMSREAIGLGLGAQAYGSRFFGNSGIPAGILTKDGTIKNPAKLREQWEAANSGSNQRRTAVLEDGVKYQSIGIPPEDSQFLETRKFQRSEICSIYRVPPHKVQDLERSTNNNIEHQSMDFVNDCLMGWLVRWEQECTRKLLTKEQKAAGYFFAFDCDQMLRGDLLSRYQSYAVARQWGWMSANDIRTRERQNRLPDEQGDIYLVPMNMVPAESSRQNVTEPEDPSEYHEQPLDAADVNKDTTLNGAQVSAATAIVTAVAIGDIPRDSGVGQLMVLFNLDQTQAEKIMGSAGNPKVATTPNPNPNAESKAADASSPVMPTNDRQSNKLRANFRSMLVDAASRFVKKETSAIRRAAKKPAEFAATVREFYDGHGDHIRSVVIPVASSMGDLLDIPFPTVRNAVGRLADVSIADAVTELSAPSIDVESIMRNWDTKRPEQFADNLLKELGL